MAQQRIRHASVFANGKKIAECFRSSVDFKSGDERAYGDEGVIGMSDGAAETDLTFDTIVPVAGSSVQVEQFILNKADVDMQEALINGKIWQCTMRCVQAKFDSDAKAGTLQGTFNFQGGAPQIT